MARTTLYAVLGVLNRGPRSGYDIRKQFQESVQYFWSESYGQIYPALREIVQWGYAEVRPVSADGRGKKLYFITDAGRSRYRQWLSEPVSPMHYRDELLLKIFFAGPEDGRTLLDLLRREQVDLEQLRETFREQEHIERVDEEGLWPLTLRYGILSTEARITWLQEAITWLEQAEERRRRNGEASD
ncbi:PadR family transcriptional regulator [Gorillibacterium timonense]|uniref:PadR family transcriptional regulator n=1 Tax=Gorillibacterium timonense TaxID=1689269 RepID=UPI00071D601F|nr:PadR family transcriptional regulator [Gorillibacterium timonense]